MMNMLHTNPFRPGSGLFPPYFAGREEEIRVFERKLRSTQDGTPMHMAVIGDWGIGKTSLLTKFEKTAENCFVTSVIASNEDTPTFISNLLMRVGTDVEAEKIKLKELEVSLVFLKLKFSSAGEAQISLEDCLRKIYERVKKPILITIDDLDLIKDFKTTMLILRNTAMQLTKKGCRIMFVVSGSPILFDKMYEAHEPLIRFFEPIILDKLTKEECIEAIKIPLDKVGINYAEKVVEKIASISDGHPYYIQEISDHVFEESDGEFDERAFKKGFSRAFSDISRDIFDKKFEHVSPMEKRVLLVLSNSKPLVLSKILRESKIRKGSLSASLSRLKEKGLLKQKERKYFIESKLFAQYIKEKV